MKVVIHNIPPSNNKYMGNSRNFNEYRLKKQEWEWLVISAIKKKPKKPYTKAMVSINYFFPDKRRRDPDNYSGKFLLDGLVKGGVIADDSFSNIELRLNGGYDKYNPRTEIEIEGAG